MELKYLSKIYLLSPLLKRKSSGSTDKLKSLTKSFQAEKFDAILSNPPYIPLIDISGLQTEVREYDPISALTDGRDGLSIIRNIIETAPGFLKSGSPLFIEIGQDQTENVRSMFSNRVWQEITFLKDFQKFDRVVKAILA